jgi:hypothetical protein
MIQGRNPLGASPEAGLNGWIGKQTPLAVNPPGPGIPTEADPHHPIANDPVVQHAAVVAPPADDEDEEETRELS